MAFLRRPFPGLLLCADDSRLRRLALSPTPRTHPGETEAEQSQGAWLGDGGRRTGDRFRRRCPYHYQTRSPPPPPPRLFWRGVYGERLVVADTVSDFNQSRMFTTRTQEGRRESTRTTRARGERRCNDAVTEMRATSSCDSVRRKIEIASTRSDRMTDVTISACRVDWADLRTERC